MLNLLQDQRLPPDWISRLLVVLGALSDLSVPPTTLQNLLRWHGGIDRVATDLRGPSQEASQGKSRQKCKKKCKPQCQGKKNAKQMQKNATKCKKCKNKTMVFLKFTTFLHFRCIFFAFFCILACVILCIFFCIFWWCRYCFALRFAFSGGIAAGLHFFVFSLGDPLGGPVYRPLETNRGGCPPPRCPAAECFGGFGAIRSGMWYVHSSSVWCKLQNTKANKLPR